MSVSGKLHNLDSGGSEAIQALLSSITSGTGQRGDGSETLTRLTAKLEDLIGEDAIKDFRQERNERGELVNEEGLPIIEITEPLAIAAERGTGNALLAEDERPPPILALPPNVRGHWKEERNRILDTLEEEERREQMREELDNSGARERILQERKEAAVIEKQKMKSAKDMQKKMGKALLRGMSGSGKIDHDSHQTIGPHGGIQRPKGDTSKKSVTFAIEEQEVSSAQGSFEGPRPVLDWGDVTPARLQPNSSKPLLRSSGTLPMKMNVVERISQSQVKISTQPVGQDSDDDSEYGELYQDSQHVPRSPEDSDIDEKPVLEEEEYDVDFVHHQREIALQYHEKRSKIGQEALAAMSSPSDNRGGDTHAVIPLDMPSEPQSKPSISRFRASRIASSYGASESFSSASTSLGASILPASGARTIQKAVRTGRLDEDGRLVGGDVESENEDETEGMQEVLELLKKGEVYNLGPDGNYIHVVPPGSKIATAAATPPVSSTAPTISTHSLPLLNRPKASKFKIDRSQAGRPPPSRKLSSNTHSSGSQTSISGAEQLSPKSLITPFTERKSSNPISSRFPGSLKSGSEFGVVSSGVVESPMPIVESHLFARPVKSFTMPSMVVESPSFPRTVRPSMAAEPPSLSNPAAPPSMIVESPYLSTDSRSPASLSPSSTTPVSRPTRPPVVVASTVRESKRASQARPGEPQFDAGISDQPGRKISRFMADRI